MTTQDVLVAALAPDDLQAVRILDMYEAEMNIAPHMAEANARYYLIEGESLKQAKRTVAEALEKVGGATWRDHLAIGRGDTEC